MATFLQIGLLNYFAIIFPALLIFFLVFAVLQKTKILGDGKTAVNAIIAIALAFILILSKDLVKIINFMTPWFVIVFIFLILLLVIFKIMGASDSTIADLLANNKGIQWVLVLIGVVILIASIAHVYGEKLLPVTEDGELGLEEGEQPSKFSSNVFKVLFNPLMLGMMFILVLAIAAIGLLTRERF